MPLVRSDAHSTSATEKFDSPPNMFDVTQDYLMHVAFTRLRRRLDHIGNSRDQAGSVAFSTDTSVSDTVLFFRGTNDTSTAAATPANAKA